MFTDNRADTLDLRKSNSYTTWYLGLDIGTSSVGWAVTGEQYHIPRLRGQRAWGVRLFEEAKTSAERRMHRIARRRYYRRGERLKYLQQIFSPYIEPIDPGFSGV
jgi:CRISPR-associated endonuclease Csn1